MDSEGEKTSEAAAQEVAAVLYKFKRHISTIFYLLKKA